MSPDPEARPESSRTGGDLLRARLGLDTDAKSRRPPEWRHGASVPPGLGSNPDGPLDSRLNPDLELHFGADASHSRNEPAPRSAGRGAELPPGGSPPAGGGRVPPGRGGTPQDPGGGAPPDRGRPPGRGGEIPPGRGDDLDDVRRRLTDILLRLPRHPRREQSSLWRAAVRAYPPLDGLPDDNPFSGVATQHQPGDPTVILLQERAGDFNLVEAALALGVQFSVSVRETGPIVLALQGGDSLSGDGPDGDTGTCGCLVEDRSGNQFLLGCNHALAGVNNCTRNQDTVRHPGKADGGQLPQDLAGTLSDYEDILTGGYAKNRMDAAIAIAADPAAVAKGIAGIGDIAGVGGPLRHGDRVRKVGWKTGLTSGKCHSTSSITPKLPSGDVALFVDQHTIVGNLPSGFAQQGDSGAAVLTEDGDELVAMIIAVDTIHGVTLAYATPIDEILTRFNVWPVM